MGLSLYLYDLSMIKLFYEAKIRIKVILSIFYFMF
nr:MAG TPA: hypothetical protein [Crassvirales sp.]